MTANTGDAIRLRRNLDAPTKRPNWPKAIVVRTLQPPDATSIHALLNFGAAEYGGEATSFDDWWASLSTNPEFDPALCFLAVDEDQKILGVAQRGASHVDLKVLADNLAARRLYNRVGMVAVAFDG